MNIAIVIATCNSHRDREKVIRKTWGKNSTIPIKFFYDEPSDYLRLPEKVKAIFFHMQLVGWDYAFKTDTDTYLNIPRLLASGFEKYDYSGHTRSEWEFPYCYGPGYWLSQRAMKIIAENPLESHSTYGDAEDLLIGKTLIKHGIEPVNDDRYSHFTPVLKGNDQILQHLSSRRQFQIEDMYEAHRRFTDGD